MKLGWDPINLPTTREGCIRVFESLVKMRSEEYELMGMSCRFQAIDARLTLVREQLNKLQGGSENG